MIKSTPWIAKTASICPSPTATDPPSDCAICPRLSAFRSGNIRDYPGFFNAPVPSFGDRTGRLLVIGLAPGLKGANRSGRPFTGDFAGDLLYATLAALGFASGNYAAAIDDGLELTDCRITNAVRCVPPGNKPETGEIRACNGFLAAEVAALSRLKAMVALGRIAHDATLTALGHRKSAFAFAHGAKHALSPNLTLFDSYHCSRYNTNTGVLTPAMFHQVMSAAAAAARAD